jgi:hypothetical protein
VTLRSPRIRPSPRQTSQVSVMTFPSPPQVGQGATETNWPNMLRVARRTSPDPLQVVQRLGLVPGLAPVPSQLVQRSGVFSLTVFLAPRATS